ncbi:Predicted transcriptional regulator, containsd two HTH domains [Halogeometricum rufum]|jgi:predicted transcriptional regulator|uniref:Predicted transcriptional regulator, containsd two HTH domains n=1 Tax=Halogeometricum rufum TaxID=553469 RepID=A0A1I6GF84_9EURY|nr:MarR family transcriptional regulator [Halogeometricum rufum]SFR40790.1 Predicted transcriptional regulator, containsd two HTH domains [Halogeometricum rufum]
MTNRGVDEEKRATLRRFAALGAATPFVGMASAETDDADDSGNDTRDAIVGYIASTPGAHFSKIRDDLQLGTGETQYHLRRLVEDGVVEFRRDGDYKRFFPAGRFTDFEQTTLGYLRRATPRGMLVALLQNPDATGSALASELDVSRATVSNYARKLEDAGLLSREDGYAVTRPETVITLLVRYADSFGPAAVALADDAASLIRYDP